MSKKGIIFSIIFVIILGSIVLSTTKKTGLLVLTPTEVSVLHNKTSLRVGGEVISPIEYQTTPELKLTFFLTDKTDKSVKIPVVYKNSKPDMFDAGRDVLLDGEIIDGTFYASTLLTQCPSKYESESHKLKN